jgi:hypothetical protein
MSDLAFCPTCGDARTGRICARCGYDYLAPVHTPTVTLSRGVNPVSVLTIIFAIVCAVPAIALVLWVLGT